MGQRHQSFIIAKIVAHGGTEPKYRCLAAFHSQWSFGTQPLFAAARVISLLKANASLVKYEVEKLHGLYGPHQQQPALPRDPAPFIGFLLGSAWCLDLGKDPHVSGVSFSSGGLHADMESFGGDNNDGITFIDATNPHDPACCFMTGSFKGPYTAEQYVRSYYPIEAETLAETDDTNETEIAKRKRQFEALIQQSIALHKDRQIIPIQHIAEAWPREYDKRAAKVAKGKTDRDSSNGFKEKMSKFEIIPNTSTVPPLASLAMAPALAHVMASGEEEEIERIIWLPNKATEILTIMRNYSPFPDNGIVMLVKALGYRSDKTTLDLTGFHLSSEQIVKVIGSLPDVKTLDLSHSETVDASSIRAVLTAHTGLRQLILLQCPKLPESEIIDMLATEPKLFYGLEALIHPLFLKRFWDTSMNPTYRSAFSYIGLHGQYSLNCASIPVFTPSSVVSSLIDFLGLILSKDMVIRWGVNQSKFPIPAAFSALPRGEEVDWNSRSVWCVPQMSYGAINGEGWSFIMETCSDGDRESKYGFIRATKESIEARRKEEEAALEAEAKTIAEKGSDPIEASSDETVTAAFETPAKPLAYEIHDLASFLVETTKEGRPEADPKLVKKLSEIFEALGKTRECILGSLEQPAVLFKQEDIQGFIKTTRVALQRAY